MVPEEMCPAKWIYLVCVPHDRVLGTQEPGHGNFSISQRDVLSWILGSGHLQHCGAILAYE